MYGWERVEEEADTEGLYEKASEEGSAEEDKRKANNEDRRKEGSTKSASGHVARPQRFSS